MNKLRLALITAPAIEPVTVAEFQKHLRLDSSNYEPSPTALTAALAGTAGNLSQGAYRYRLTYVTADGETDGGIISSAITATTDNSIVNLSSIPLGGSLVTSRKIYRTEAGGSDYKLLTTISNNTASTYQDNIADGSLGAGCPTTNTTDDPELLAFIKTARQIVEKLTGNALINQTWDYYLDNFPSAELLIPVYPLSSITSIAYYDSNSVLQTWSSSEYNAVTQQRPGYVYPAYNYDYPTTGRGHDGDVIIRFVAGYGATAASVPENLKLAIKILAAHFYENREAVSFSGEAKSIPFSVKMLIDQDKCHWWGNFS